MILLYSFEGTTFRYSDNSYKDTPVPMPNTEVKLVNAESTWLEAIWEDRKLLNKISISYEVLFLLCISSQIASGLACYVRKYKLNFRNRELLDKRQHFPTGAESTCLEGRTAGGKSPCGSTFSDHPMDNLTSQLQKKEIRRISKRILRLAVELLNKETHHRDVMSFFN